MLIERIRALAFNVSLIFTARYVYQDMSGSGLRLNQRISVTNQWFVFVCSPAWLQIVDAFETYWGYVWIIVRTRKIATPCWLLLPFCTLFLPLDIGLFSFRCNCIFHVLVQSAIGHHCPLNFYHTLVAVRWATEKVWLGRLTGWVSREDTTSPALALNTSLWNSQATIRLTEIHH